MAIIRIKYLTSLRGALATKQSRLSQILDRHAPRALDDGSFFIISFCMFLLVLISTTATHAQTVISSGKPVTNKIEKHFDQNHDKVLNWQEQGRLRTHLYLKYPLARKKIERYFDADNDGMLEPTELASYQKAKTEGQFGEIKKKIRSKKKLKVKLPKLLN